MVFVNPVPSLEAVPVSAGTAVVGTGALPRLLGNESPNVTLLSRVGARSAPPPGIAPPPTPGAPGRPPPIPPPAPVNPLSCACASSEPATASASMAPAAPRARTVAHSSARFTFACIARHSLPRLAHSKGAARARRARIERCFLAACVWMRKSRLVRVNAFEQDPRQARQADRGDNNKDPHERSPSLYEPNAQVPPTKK